jgi:hypothetical protein
LLSPSTFYACPATQALGIKKVALLFLTTGNLHHEQAWRLWFASAAGLVPGPAAEVRRRAVARAIGNAAPAGLGFRRLCPLFALAIRPHC